MPASKLDIFNMEERNLAIFGRAIAHPARVRIMDIVRERGSTKNCELTKELKLTKSTIHEHLKKLEDAKLIKMEFHSNGFLILKNESSKFSLFEYLTEK